MFFKGEFEKLQKLKESNGGKYAFYTEERVSDHTSPEVGYKTTLHIRERDGSTPGDGAAELKSIDQYMVKPSNNLEYFYQEEEDS